MSRGTLNTHTGLTPHFDLAFLPNVTEGGYRGPLEMGSADLTDCRHKEACGGLKPPLTGRSYTLCASEGEKRKRKKRGVPQTIENNTQRAFNDFILMLCKWLNLSEDTQQELCCGEKCIDSKHAI